MSTWHDPRQAYLVAMSAANRSAATIRLHRHYLHILEVSHPDPWMVTLPDLQAELIAHGWEGAGMASARSVWRGFYKWAHGVGLIDEWVAEQLAPVTVPVGLPRPAPETVVAGATRRGDERVRFMAMLGAFAGLRAGEIAQVHADDVRGDLLTVHGKGRKERIVPIVHAELLTRLQALDGWAFPNRQGKPMTAGHVSKLLSESMPPGWTAHTLRHRFATQAYDGTGDLLAVRELLGHANVATTQVYVKVSANKLRAAVEATA